MYLHNLQTVLPDFKSNQNLILTRWMQKHHVVQFLQNYKVKPIYFIQEYALRLISNVINMVENDFPSHQYMVTKEALVSFSDKDINPHDIFCLYQSLKDVCIELIEEGNILSSPIILNKDRIIIDIYKVFERLTHDILYFYAEEFFDINSEYTQAM
ncbi:MAG: hypothetical protein COA44_06800 [Arcobacter sp.]|nr:MAG: hypothetical protein COA44_06800 [Arcobacter sp.]